MEEEEIKKKFEELDREVTSGKMAGLMLVMVKAKEDDEQFKAFKHVMENFTKEEMAFVVTVHSAMSIQEAITKMPELKSMIGAINVLQDLEDKVKEDDERGSESPV